MVVAVGRFYCQTLMVVQELKAHPDTNSPGTKGCIGFVGNYQELKKLGDFFNDYIAIKGNRMIFDFNIKDNPNYGNEGRANAKLAQ